MPIPRIARAILRPSHLVWPAASLICGNANADLNFCNQTPIPVFAAVERPDGGAWVSQGWYSFAPGSCGSVLSGDLTSRYYYYYAEGPGGHTWSGANAMCVLPGSAFTIHGSDACEQRGFESKPAVQVDTGDADDFTINLSCDDCLENAQAPLPATGNATLVDVH